MKKIDSVRHRPSPVRTVRACLAVSVSCIGAVIWLCYPVLAGGSGFRYLFYMRCWYTNLQHQAATSSQTPVIVSCARWPLLQSASRAEISQN